MLPVFRGPATAPPTGATWGTPGGSPKAAMITVTTVSPRRCTSIPWPKISGSASMLDRTLLPPHIVITAQDLQNTPPVILTLLEYLLQENMALKKRVEAQGRPVSYTHLTLPT